MKDVEDKIKQAMQSGSVERLAYLIPYLSHGVHTIMDSGCSLLRLAVNANSVASTEWLLKRGACLESDEHADPLVSVAAEKGSINLVKLLLQHSHNLVGQSYFNHEMTLNVAAYRFCETFFRLLSVLDFDTFWQRFSDEVLQTLLPKQVFLMTLKTADSSLAQRTLMLNQEIAELQQAWRHLFGLRSSPWFAFNTQKNLVYGYTPRCLALYDLLKDVLIYSLFIHQWAYSAELSGCHQYRAIYYLIEHKLRLDNPTAPLQALDEMLTEDEKDVPLLHTLTTPQSTHVGKRLPRQALQHAVDQLNAALKATTEQALIDWSKYPRFFIAQYQGFHFYRHHLTKVQRSTYRHTIHLNRLAPEPAIYWQSSIMPIHALFQSKNDVAIGQALAGPTSEPFNCDPTRIHLPHYLTSDRPDLALWYGYGQAKLAELTKWRLKPVFQADGQPLHPYLGKVFITLLTPWQAHSLRTQSSSREHPLQKAPTKAREDGAGHLFYEALLKVPSLVAYQADYAGTYGLSRERFNALKKQLDTLYSVPHQRRKALRKQLNQLLLRDTLLVHQERRLLEYAEQEAIRQGGYLLYRHADQTYALDPENSVQAMPASDPLWSTKEKMTPEPIESMSKKRNIAQLSSSSHFSDEEVDILSTDDEEETADFDMDDELEQAKRESLAMARKEGLIGPRHLLNWELNDVKDDGNCFYLAVVDQLKYLQSPIITRLPEATPAEDGLRRLIQGHAFKDRQWAEDEQIEQLARKLDLIVAIVDTRYPERGFCAYYINAAGVLITHTGQEELSLPQKTVIKLAATGNHFLSVRRHPLLCQGAYRSGSGYVKDTPVSTTSLSYSASRFFGSRVNRPGQSIEVAQSVSALKRVGLSAKQILKQRLFDQAWQLASAVDNGDCFYDALAQALNSNNDVLGSKGCLHTIKSLRKTCSDYLYELDKGVAGTNWVKEAIEKDSGLGEYQNHLATLQYSQEEMEQLHREHHIFSGYAIWGRPHIEGRILADKLNVRLHVIELRDADKEIGELPPIHLLVTGASVKQIEAEEVDYNDYKAVHLAVYRNHFVPILLTHLQHADAGFSSKELEQAKIQSLKTAEKEAHTGLCYSGNRT